MAYKYQDATITVLSGKIQAARVWCSQRSPSGHQVDVSLSLRARTDGTSLAAASSAVHFSTLQARVD